MYAECALRTNQNVSDAVIKFNKVRTRANMPEVAALTEDLILDERRMELCMEWGERFNDLVRTGKAVQVLTAAGYNYTDDKKYMPIAKAAIDITPALGEDVVE